MSEDTLKWVIPIVVGVVAGLGGWITRQYKYKREEKKRAEQDARNRIEDEITYLEELTSKTKDDGQKVHYQQLIIERNQLLMGLSSTRIRRTLGDAGLSEEQLLAEGKNRLNPQQTNQIKEEIDERKKLPQSDSIEELFTLAAANYYTEQYEEAIDALSEIIRLRPKNESAYINRGLTYHALEKYDRALDDYKRAEELEPSDADIFKSRGDIYTELEEYRKALDNYARAIELDPNYADAYYNRGNVYTELKEYRKALADYKKAIKHEPDHAGAFNNRGNIYLIKKEYRKALHNFNESIKLNPENADALYNSGITNIKLKQYDEALADLKQTLDIQPENADALYNIAVLYSLQNNIDDALKYLEEAINIDESCSEDAKTEKDFVSIMNDPRFKKLVGE